MSERHHILAVDDEPENLNLLRRLFEPAYKLHTARTADEALRTLESRPVDLILCDQRMEGLSGVDLLEKVAERWPSVVRILVTAYADVEAAIDAINRGKVRRYLSKPWENEELEAIVAQELRVHDLQSENERMAKDLEERNRRLLEANRELESLDRMKSKLLSTVSHELKTPLISIKGYAEMMAAGRGGAIPDKARAFVDGIQRSTERLESLIGNLLQGGRMASETEALVLTEIDLAAWARKAVRAVEALAEAKGVSVEISAKIHVPILADATSVDRILENLLSNAVKFNVRGGEVRVTVRREGSWAELLVADTGIGIPRREQGRVFERFFQTEEARKFGGTGIGLSIVKDAVERHGGKIELGSIPGKGTTFRVLLPTGAVESRDDTGVFKRLSPWEGFVLLLADPEEGGRDVERATLLADGFAVLEADTLAKATAREKKHAPHAVLMDLALFDEEGAPPAGSSPFAAPWIAMLRNRDEIAVERALSSGAQGCVLKPLRKKEFLFLLEKTVGRKWKKA